MSEKMSLGLQQRKGGDKTQFSPEVCCIIRIQNKSDSRGGRSINRAECSLMSPRDQLPAMAAAKPHASTPDSGEPEKGADPVERPMVDASAQPQPLSGPKLLLVMAGVAVVILLAMLDISIISTVGFLTTSTDVCSSNHIRQSPKSQVTFTGLKTWAGMSVPISLPGKCQSFAT